MSAGVLSDLEILKRLVAPDDECIFVSPLVDPGVQLGPSSLDVRLGTELVVKRTTSSTHMDLSGSRSDLKARAREYSVVRRIGPAERFVLHPGEFTLAHTLEFIRLPRDIAARLEGRSSLGRLGLQVHATAGFVDPGYEGVLTFELINSGKLPVALKPGIRLGQLCFFSVQPVQIPYNKRNSSKYSGKLSVALSQIDEDREMGD